MSVKDRNKVDFIYFEDNEIILELFDDLLWNEEILQDHWMTLQEKIKNYVGFIKSGQLQENYPDINKKPCIKIVFLYEWPLIVEKYLEKLREIHKNIDIILMWERYQQYTD